MSFTVIEGSGSVVATLELLLDQAREGKIEGLAYATCTSDDGDPGKRGAVWRPNMQYPVPRLVCATDGLLDLLRKA